MFRFNLFHSLIIYGKTISEVVSSTNKYIESVGVPVLICGSKLSIRDSCSTERTVLSICLGGDTQAPMLIQLVKKGAFNDPYYC